MKSAEDHDRIAEAKGIITFEMEGAGVWDHFPSVVIKSVCDYADSHKHKRWQDYAIATAAACMKAFLIEWTAEDESPEQGVSFPCHLFNLFIARMTVYFFLEQPFGPLWCVPSANIHVCL